MPLSADSLRSHLDYTAWASGLLVDAARQLLPEELNRDFGTGDKSVFGTLRHIYAGDRIWLERVRGDSPGSLIRPGDLDFDALQQAWPEVLQDWKDWAAGLTDATAQSDIPYRLTNGSGDQQPAWQIVMHLVNHGTHHRGAVSGFLRAMGHPPPKLDLIIYYRSLAAARSTAS